MATKKLAFSLLFVCLLLPSSFGATPKILITRAGESTSKSGISQGWFSAVSENYYYLRLEPIQKCDVISQQDFAKAFGKKIPYGLTVPEEKLTKTARELRADYMLIHTYEVSGTEVNYLLEIIKVKDRSVVMTFDKSFMTNGIGPNLEECAQAIIEKLAITPSSKIQEVLKRPILSQDVNNLKNLGLLLIKLENSTDPKIVKKIQKIVDKEPTFALAAYAAAVSYESMEQCDQAARLYNQLTLRNGLYYPKLYLRASRNFRTCQSYDLALRTLLSATKRGWKTPELMLEKAYVYEKTNRRSEAFKLFKEIHTLDPDQPEALLFMARQHRDNGNHEQSLTLANKLISMGKHLGKAYLEKGENEYAQKKYENALKSLARAHELLADEPRAPYLLGEIFFFKKKYGKAAYNYSKALTKMSSNLDLLLKTMNSYRQAKDTKNALAILQKYKSNFYDTKVVTKEIGLLKFQLRDTSEARSLLETCVNIKPPDGDVFLALGDIYAASGENIKATMMYEKAEPLIEDKIRIKLALANLYIQTKKFELAESQLKTILASKPHYPKANQYYADVLRQKKQFNPALTHYLKEREKHGNTKYLQTQIADIYFLLNNYPKAEKELLALVKLMPAYSKAYFQLSIIALKSKKMAQSEKYLSQAEVTGKVDPTIYKEMAEVLFQSKSYAKSIKFYNKYLTATPKDQKGWEALAQVYKTLKKDSSVSRVYVTIWKLNQPKNQSYLAKAGHLLFNKGLKTKAGSLYDQFITKGYKEDQVFINHGSVKYAAKDYQTTISLLKKVSSAKASNTQVLRMLALSNYQLKKYSEASPYFTKLTPKLPKDKELIETAALNHEKGGSLKAAVAMYAKFLTFPKTSKHQEYAYHLATLYEKQKAVSLALDQYRKNITLYPNDIRNYEKLVDLYVKAKNYAAAIKIINKALTKPKAPIKLYTTLIMIYDQQKNYTLAAITYEKYLKKEPKNDSAWYALGSIYMKQKNYAKAITPLQKASNLKNRNVTYLFTLAEAYTRSGNTSKAISTYRKALSYAPKEEKQWKALGKIYVKTKNDTATARVYRKIYNLNPKVNSSYLSKAGNLYYKVGLKDEANKAYNEFVQKGFKNAEVNKKSATIEFAKKNYSKTITLLKGLTGKNAQSTTVLRMLALSYYHTNKHANAITSLKKLIPRKPGDKELIEIAALSYEKTGDLKSASVMYKSYLDLKPKKKLKEYSLHLAELYEKQKATGLALTQYKKNMVLFPTELVNYERLVALYSRSKDFTAAAGIIKKAIAKKIAPPDFYLKLIHIYTLQNNKALAATTYEQYLVKKPNEDSAWYALGTIYTSQKQYQKAVVPLEKAVKLKPRKSEYLFSLAQVYEKTKNTSKAISTYNTALKYDTRNETILLALAGLYKKTKREKDMANIYKKLFDLNPKKNSAYLSKAGHLYYKQGMTEEAQAVYSRYLSKGHTDPKINVNLAKLEFKNKRYAKTVDLLKNLPSAQKSDKEVLNMQVVSYYNLKKYTLAVPYLKLYLPKVPKNRDITEIAAISYEKTGNLKSAAAMYKKFLTFPKTEKSQDYAFHLGQLYEQQKALSLAIAQYESNTTVYPNDFRNFEKLIELYKKAKNYAKAVVVLKKVTAKSASSVRFDRELIDIYKLQKKKTLAAAAYEKYVKKAPNDDSAWFDMGSIYLSLNNYKKAVVALEKAARLQPRSSNYSLTLASAYEKSGQKNKALFQYQDGLRNDPTNEKALKKLISLYTASKMNNDAADAHFKLYELAPTKYKVNLSKAAHLYHKLGKKSQAKMAYEKLIASGYKDSKASYNLATMEYEAKNYQKAITLLKALPKEYAGKTDVIKMLAFSYNNTNQAKFALPYLKQLTARTPNDIVVVEMTAKAYEQSGNLKSAASMYKKYLTFKSAPKRKEYSFTLASLYEKTKQFNSAIVQYEANIKSYPQELKNYENLITLYTNAKRFDNAIKVLSKAVKLPGASSAMDKSLAEIYLKQGKKKAASSAYANYLKKAPNDYDAWFTLGTIYYGFGMLKEAIPALDKATKGKPSDSDLFFKLGNAYYKTEQFKLAVSPLKKAYELNKTDTKILGLLTQCYMATGNTQSLIAILEKRALKEPNNYEILFQLGNMYLAANKTSQAIKTLEKASKAKPADINTHMTLISLYENNKEKQIEHINTALRYSANNADLHYEKAMHLLSSGLDSKVKASLKKAIQLNPEHALAHFEYGKLLKSDKNYKAAYHHFNQASRIEESNADYLLELTETAFLAGKKELAMKSVNKALRIDPNNAKMLAMQGNLYLMNDQPKKAETTLLKALKIDNSCASCNEHLGTIYFNRTDYPKAITYLKKAVTKDPTNDAALIKLGNALIIRKQKKQALNYFNKAYAANGKNDEAFYRVCATNIELGNIKAAEALIRKNSVKIKSGWNHLANGRVLEASNNMQLAASSYKLAIKSMPNNSDAHMGMGRVQLEQKKYNKAITSFSRAMVEQPDNVAIWIGMGKGYFMQNNFDAAIELLSDVIKKQPDNAEAHNLMGLAFRKMGKHSAAINSLEKSLKYEPKNPDAHFVLALEYEDNLNFQSAIKSFLNTIKYDGTKAVHVYPRIGDTYYYKLKDSKKAKKYYQKYLDVGGTSSKIKKLLKTL